MHEERLRRQPGVFEGDRHELVPVERAAPAGPGELAVVEVADRVRGEQPVALEERPQEHTIGRRPGDDRVALALDRHRRHQLAACAGGSATGAGASAARRGVARGDGRCEGGAERRDQRALLGHDRGDEVGRGDVEGRVPDGRPGRSHPDAAELEELGRVPLLDRDRRPVRRLEVDRAQRRADVERHPVTGREGRQRVRPDLVGRVAVGRDPVGADEDRVDRAGCQQRTGRPVGDERVRHAGLLELPGGQPGALEERPRLVDVDVDLPAGVNGRLDDPERGAELAAGERAGVAVGEHPDRPIERAAGASARPCSASRPWSSVASAQIASASAHMASAMTVPSSSSEPTDSIRASIRSTAQPRLTAVGRAFRSVLAAARMIARRANGLRSIPRPAVSARP